MVGFLLRQTALCALTRLLNAIVFNITYFSTACIGSVIEVLIRHLVKNGQTDFGASQHRHGSCKIEAEMITLLLVFGGEGSAVSSGFFPGLWLRAQDSRCCTVMSAYVASFCGCIFVLEHVG